MSWSQADTRRSIPCGEGARLGAELLVVPVSPGASSALFPGGALEASVWFHVHGILTAFMVMLLLIVSRLRLPQGLPAAYIPGQTMTSPLRGEGVARPGQVERSAGTAT